MTFLTYTVSFKAIIQAVFFVLIFLCFSFCFVGLGSPYRIILCRKEIKKKKKKKSNSC